MHTILLHMISKTIVFYLTFVILSPSIPLSDWKCHPWFIPASQIFGMVGSVFSGYNTSSVIQIAVDAMMRTGSIRQRRRGTGGQHEYHPDWRTSLRRIRPQD